MCDPGFTPLMQCNALSEFKGRFSTGLYNDCLDYVRTWLSCANFSDGDLPSNKELREMVSIHEFLSFRSWLEDCEKVLEAFQKAHPGHRPGYRAYHPKKIRLLNRKGSPGMTISDLIRELEAFEPLTDENKHVNTFLPCL